MEGEGLSGRNSATSLVDGKSKVGEEQEEVNGGGARGGRGLSFGGLMSPTQVGLDEKPDTPIQISRIPQS